MCFEIDMLCVNRVEKVRKDQILDQPFFLLVQAILRVKP